MALSLRPRWNRARAAWAVAAAAGACAAVASTFACITAPPPDPPVLQPCRPSVDQTSVNPPLVITEWPTHGVFVIPVTYSSCDPSGGFYYNAFIDSTAVYLSSVQAYALNGGATFVEVGLPQPNDGTTCHRIDVLVAHGFDPMAPHTPDSIGGDVVTWLYSTTGQINGCPGFDAGSGAFPDASTDTLPFVPDGGSE